MVGFGKISPNEFKSVENCLYTTCFEGIYQNFDLFLAKCMNFIISRVLMDGNNQNFDYFLIKFSDFDQINTGRITFDLFY